MAKRDYYEVLGLTKSATADEIKKAHRKLVRQYHPDVNKDNKGAEEKFKEVQEAYDVLSDETKRGNYDQFGHAGVGGGVGGGGDPFDAFRRQQGRGGAGGNGKSWRGGPNVTVEEFDPNDFGAGGFGDIFEQLFGRGAAGAGSAGRPGAGPRQRTRPAPQPQQQRGADANHPVTLTFEQAARGTMLPLQINRDGRLETIDIKIPAGVRDGSRVRIKGKGQQAAAGESGDLFIITHVKPHAHFRREDLDVLLELPISLYEAMLGTKVSVPTLDGPVTLTIPPGTSSHAKLRIKGRGVFRGEEKGDQHVITRVIVPKDLTDEDKELLAKLQSRHPIDAQTDVQW